MLLGQSRDLFIKTFTLPACLNLPIVICDWPSRTSLTSLLEAMF